MKKPTPQTPKDIQRMLDFMYEDAVRCLTEQGETPPLMAAITANNECMLMPLLWSNNHEKYAILEQIKKIFKAKNVIAFYMSTEAWMGTAHKDDTAAQQELQKYQGHFEDMPSRVEVVLNHYVSYDEVRMLTYEIHRDAEGKFTHLGEPKEFSSKPGDESFAVGNLVRLLPGLLDHDFTKAPVD